MNVYLHHDEPDTTPIDHELATHDEEVEQSAIIDESVPLVPLSGRDMRSFAFHIMYAAEQFDYSTSLESIVDNLRRGFNIDISDDANAVIMARGAIEHREQLDKELMPLLKNWRIERLGICTRLIFRLALWELLYTDTPGSIVINEAIELAKAFAEKDAYKFINGVLDEVARRLGKTTQPKEVLYKEQEEEASSDVSSTDFGEAEDGSDE